jgi:hypothetical protein
MRPMMIKAGALTEEDCALLAPLYEQPSFMFISPILFGAWGRHAS